MPCKTALHVENKEKHVTESEMIAFDSTQRKIFQKVNDTLYYFMEDVNKNLSHTKVEVENFVSQIKSLIEDYEKAYKKLSKALERSFIERKLLQRRLSEAQRFLEQIPEDKQELLKIISILELQKV